ncbi:MAG: hypothetical protein WB647_16865 [Roseiarcus sp.]|uniref:hypothetical protein n=1 Tax=Roseiarcus sp. TaxID=1969460 RepID=UPI003C6055B6
MSTWITCTSIEGRKPIQINMALAATYVEHKGGTRIWVPVDEGAIDVVETPDQIAAAISDIENASRT